MKKNMQGFTLIELMIVVAIIAILAAIALPAYRDYTIKAKFTNAIGSIAGEKIKVGENYGSGTPLCSGVATAAACASGVLTGTYDGVSAVLTPDTSAGRIDWDCVVSGPDKNTNNTPKGCS